MCASQLVTTADPITGETKHCKQDRVLRSEMDTMSVAVGDPGNLF